MRINKLDVSYGTNKVIDGLSLDIGDGITCIMGESGCGKTTLLRAIAGLVEPEGGEIEGKPRTPSVMFQEDRLFPWLTALENIEAVIGEKSENPVGGEDGKRVSDGTTGGQDRKKASVGGEDRKRESAGTTGGRSKAKVTAGEPCKHERAKKILELVELSEAAGKMPDELSGGMQRRVALARALAFEGDMLILDEPFKGIDEELKVRIAGLIRECKVPVLVATHDRSDVALLGAELIYMGKPRGEEKPGNL